MFAHAPSVVSRCELMKRELISKLCLREDGKQALLFTLRYFKARTVFIIGSVARHDMNASSDLDVLILTDKNIRSALFYQTPAIQQQSLPISVITYSPKDFLKFWQEGSLFVHHVLQEEILVWDDGTFKEIASRAFHLKEDFSDDIQEQFDKLKTFRNPRAFNGIFTHVYARLWSIYRNIVLFSLAQCCKPEFNKKKHLTFFIVCIRTCDTCGLPLMVFIISTVSLSKALIMMYFTRGFIMTLIKRGPGVSQLFI